jgi:cell division protein FtsQ
LRKINYRKLMTLVMWITAVSGILASLSFAAARGKQVTVHRVDAVVKGDEESFFITDREVAALFTGGHNSVIGQPVSHVDLRAIEDRLNNHPAISKAEVSHGLDGVLKLSVTQRKPVLRVINHDGESYYIDADGRLMPLSDNFTARVIVASGEIFEPYSRRYPFTMSQIGRSKVFSELSVLDDLFAVTNAVNADTTLSALIHQIYVNRDGEMELFPAVGEHRIVFGDGSDIDGKFRKLKLFYREGLSRSDSWQKYSQINLKFRNLVVCTKKQTI